MGWYAKYGSLDDALQTFKLHGDNNNSMTWSAATVDVNG